MKDHFMAKAPTKKRAAAKKKTSNVERAEEILKNQEKQSAVDSAKDNGLDLYEKPDGSYIRLNRQSTTIEAAHKLNWKMVK